MSTPDTSKPGTTPQADAKLGATIELKPVRAEQLSAFFDGELQHDDADALCKDAARDLPLAARFSSYALIGDVLRTPELALHTRGDGEAFMQRMRDALAAEPVVLVPAALPAAPLLGNAPKTANGNNRALRNWGAGVASLAGVAALVMALAPRGEQSGRELASVSAPAVTAASQAAFTQTAQTAQNAAPAGLQNAPAAGLQLVETRNGKMIRDPQLDQYLQAHLRMGSSVVAPAAFVRSQKVQVTACVEC
jgi:sigma-E factor negative regulatory protein RseA